MKLKMTYKELREYMQKLEKFPGCEMRARAPLIHEGFPGTFNLSFTEYDYNQEYGNLSNFYKDMVLSAIQSCVRPHDIDENIRNNKDLWKYLGVFEMADVGGAVLLSNQKKADEIHRRNIWQLTKTLKELGLDLTKVYPTYNTGGRVSEVTNGKYSFDFVIPEDSLSKNEFEKIGIPKRNIIGDKTRDTFLSLQISGMKSPWGYRNEILYDIGNRDSPKLLDIGTIERCLWFPLYSGEEKTENIIGLEEMPHTFNIAVLGLERLLTAVNGLSQVREVDFIQNFYDAYRKVAPTLTEDERYKSGEVIRAMHRIQSDVVNLGIKWSEPRKKKRRRLMQTIYKNNRGLRKEELEAILEVHAETQPWHPELKKGITPTIDLILGYLGGRR